MCEWAEGPSKVRVDFSSEFIVQPTKVSESLLFFFASSFIRLYVRPSVSPLRLTHQKLASGCSWQVDMKWHQYPGLRVQGIVGKTVTETGAGTHKHDKVFTPPPLSILRLCCRSWSVEGSSLWPTSSWPQRRADDPNPKSYAGFFHFPLRRVQLTGLVLRGAYS